MRLPMGQDQVSIYETDNITTLTFCEVRGCVTIIARDNTARNLAGPAVDAPLSQSRDYYDGRFACYDANDRASRV